MLPARSLFSAKIVQVEDNAKKNTKFFQLALLRRRLFYEKIVQVEDNAKEKPK